MSLSVSTNALQVVLDSETGRVLSVRNLARDLDLISTPPSAPPFRIELGEIGIVEEFSDFTAIPLANGVRLIWVTTHGITLTSDVLTRGDEIIFTLEALNQGEALIDRIEYPILDGIGRLAGKGQDDFVHTHATGVLFHDPVDLFAPDPENKRRLSFSPYPEGFAGSTMQFVAYYARGKGGFYVGTEDSRKDLKWFNFFKAREGEALTCTIMHRSPVFQAGRSLTINYPIVIAPLVEGTWYEAADRYRAWAFNQAWAQPTARSKWLLEEVGVCTFGINARYDRSGWLDDIDKMAGTPVFHILGPNWAAWGHDYHNNLPRGRADWFPAVFHPNNLDVIKRNGDYWAPFEFDMLAGHNPAYADPILASRMQINDLGAALSDPGILHFPFLCPGTKYAHDLHVERDARLVGEYGADALYYDISVSNLLLQCAATDHDHLPGSGSTLGDLFTTMYRDTSAAMAKAGGAYAPFGTEVISEIFVDVFDYYQARAEGIPYAPFETAAFRDWLIAGDAEKIPLFKYAFQERSPLRMDGWARPSTEIGDLFYWTSAQTLLNGGLLELNYEFSQLEDRNGESEALEEHYYKWEDRHFTLDPAKANFIGEIARGRTGAANPFLAYGQMLPAPTVDAAPAELAFKTVNVFRDDKNYEAEGTMKVPSVLATSWQHSGRAIHLAVNLLDKPQSVAIDGKSHTLPPRQIKVIEL